MKALPTIAAATAAADLAAKAAALRAFGGGRSVSVLPGFFDLRLVLNRGAAWGMLAGRRAALVAVSAGMLALLWADRRELASTRLSTAGAGLLAGGIAGNLFDRVFRGEVVDFLDFHWKTSWYFPVFNLADAAITAGVALLLLSSLPWFRAKRQSR